MSKFAFFQSYYESLKELPPEDFKSVVCAMCAYVFEDKEVKLDGVPKTVFLLIKPVLEKSREITEKRSRAGMIGAIAKQSGNKSPAKPKQTVSKREANGKQNFSNEIAEIVDFLNASCGTHYRPDTEGTRKKIVSLLGKGFSVADFKTVIEKKANEWMGGKMERYLTPDTLFSGKFEGYLNQKVIEDDGVKNAKVHNFAERKYDVKSLEERLMANK